MKQYRIKAASAAQLAAEIERGVADGTLAPGERLPSVRRLAAEVGLSPVTVASALAELRRRGLVVSEPRRATRIGPGAPAGVARVPVPVAPGARDLSQGNPDPALLPDLRRALRRCAAPQRLYGEAPAIAALLELARERLRADGIAAEHLCVLSGSMDAIERVLALHLRPGDRVAVENPGYAALYDLLRARGLVLEPVSVDDRGMLPGDLRSALARGAAAAVITPRGQNPLGAALDGKRAEALRTVLDDFPGALVVEDDHLGLLAGAPLHSLVPGRERWAAARSVAKALGPDLRLAILAGDGATIARVQGLQQRGPGWVSHILQALVLSLWSDPDVAALVERAAAVYAQRRERLLECLAREGVPAHGASGLNVWVPVHEETASVTALMQRGWALAPGAPYRLPGAGAGVRITTAALAEHDAPRLAADIAETLAPSALSRSG